MIQRQLTLRRTTAQATPWDTWLWSVTGVWHWAIRTIAHDAPEGIHYSPKDCQNLWAHHRTTLGLPRHTLQGMRDAASTAWQRCYHPLANKPRRKGRRTHLPSIPFPDPLTTPARTPIQGPGMGPIRFHAPACPAGRLTSGRIVKRASGWSLWLCMAAPPQAMPHGADGALGMDPGLQTLRTCSTGAKVAYPHALRQRAHRLAQAQRGVRTPLTARRHERLANQPKDRPHTLSRRLVAEHRVLIWSKDNATGLARAFGKSVARAAPAQLRRRLASKCTASGRQSREVPARFSTKTCAACGRRAGPPGYAGVAGRPWVCAACGAAYDRAVHAAMHTLAAGVGMPHARRRKTASGIPCL